MSSMLLARSWEMIGFADLVLTGLALASVAYLSLAPLARYRFRSSPEWRWLFSAAR